MVKKIISGLNQRKVKVFVLFLLCSVLAWSISKFSESYESRARFELEYTQFPDSLLLNTEALDFVMAKLRASGFQFLNYGINPKKIRINLSKVSERGGSYFLTQTALKTQLERQLPNTVSLLELEKDTFFVNLYQVDVKKVSVKPNIELNLAQNHILDGALLVVPDSITLKGPKEEISKITELSTSPIVLNDLTEDFSNALEVVLPAPLNNTIVLEKTIKVSGKVVRFSEKEFEVSIKAINLPEGYRIRMFPNTTSLVCKAGVDRLKSLTSEAFEIIVDYGEMTNNEGNFLNLELKQRPEGVYSVRLLNDRVKFVLEKL